VALDSNIYHIELALEGKFDFIKKTNPWRTQKDIDEENFGKSIGKENVARKLQAWAIGMQGYRPDKTKRGKKEGIVLPPGMEMPTIPIKKDK